MLQADFGIKPDWNNHGHGKPEKSDDYGIFGGD
jgi:hypothetical protein